MKNIYVLLMLFLFSVNNMCSQSWVPIGTIGFSGNIDVMVTDTTNNILYAGGWFETVDGTTVNYVAQWDGNQWSSLGNGVQYRVIALEMYNGELYAGGWFTFADSIPVGYIAKWDGVNWSAVGSGMDDDVLSLKTINGELYAGGMFSNAGGVQAEMIAKWDGANWSAVGSDLGLNSVSCIEEYQDNIYIGGYIHLPGNDSTMHVAMLDGNTWKIVGGGVSYNVYCMQTFQDDLYIGGWFVKAGNDTVNYIARWDGVEWHSLGTGTNDRVFDLHVYNNELYVGGNYTSVNGSTAYRIAKWDGIEWQTLNSTLNGMVGSISTYNEELYIGGNFYDGTFKRIAKMECQYPILDFSYSIDGQIVSLIDSTEFVNEWYWDFGDGNMDTIQNPVHEYSDTGTYQICLTAYNDCGLIITCIDITIVSTDIKSEETMNKFKITPNPFSKATVIEFDNPLGDSYTLSLYNSNGQLVHQTQDIKTEKAILERNNLKKGVYLFQITNESKTALFGKLIIQ